MDKMSTTIALVTLTLPLGVFNSSCSSRSQDASSSSVANAPAAPVAASPAAADYRDDTDGFAILIPANVISPSVDRRAIQRADFFSQSFFGHSGWNAFTETNDSGQHLLLRLGLQGSNKITSGELRLGASAKKADINACLTPPPEAAASKLRRVDLDGVDFVHFGAEDAAMSHYRQIDAYRAVMHGRCYAIDLIVTGSQPQVYAPPPTVPFTQAQALDQLRTLLKNLRWLR